MYDCTITIEILPGQKARNIHLISSTPLPFPSSATFEFLTYVYTAQIPLRLAAGPSLQVWTDSQATEDFFNRVLIAEKPGQSRMVEEEEEHEWWTGSGTQSPKGILVRVPAEKAEGWNGPRITELLFYGAVEGEGLRVSALLLSSDLLGTGVDTPPLSPARELKYEEDIEAQFLLLPEDWTGQTAVSPKRKKMDDVFDQAVQRRRKARRSGGEGIAAAAAGAALDGHRRSISLEHKATIPESRRSVSLDQNAIKPDPEQDTIRRDFYSQASALPARPHSRASSISSDARPLSRKDPPEQTKRSSLFQVTSAAEAEHKENIETKNKEAITRLVMAGMRLYGMQQSKTGRTRRNSVAPSVAESIGESNTVVTAGTAAKDEEYKIVFHQAYRGTCVAFRNHITTKPLYLHPNRLQDTVDKLLAILCNDPLLHPLSESRATEIAITPSRRPEKHGAFNPAFSGSRDVDISPKTSLELPTSQLEVRRSPLASRGVGF